MPASWDEMAVVGRIARAHGNRGQVIVNPETDFPELRFRSGAELFVERSGVVQPIVVTSVRFQHDRPVIAFARAEDGSLRGSARSVPGINIRDALDSVAARRPDLIDKFGGHAMAAGLTVQPRGALFVDGLPGPPVPWLPSGWFF